MICRTTLKNDQETILLSILFQEFAMILIIPMNFIQKIVYANIANPLQHVHHPFIAVVMKLSVNVMKTIFRLIQKNIIIHGKDKLMGMHSLIIQKKIKLILKNISPGPCVVWTVKL